MTELLSVQMSWGNGGCTRAVSSGDQQTREFGPLDARRSRAIMRANPWGHDELGTNTEVMLMKIEFSKCLLFVKSHCCYSSNNKQLIVHEKLEHDISALKSDIICHYYVYKVI